MEILVTKGDPVLTFGLLSGNLKVEFGVNQIRLNIGSLQKS